MGIGKEEKFMYKGYDLTLSEQDISSLLGENIKYYSEYTNSITTFRENLCKSICKRFDLRDENEALDAELLKNKWFPSGNYDLFISHSHKDVELAKKLASWLYERFELKAFIDSTVWGYVDELLRQIDNKYCILENTSDGITYNYEKRNYSTTHVHLLLASALREMIDKCECLFFLNTTNSISLSDSIESLTTESPWIYDELQNVRFLERKKPRRALKEVVEKKSEFQNKDLIVKYDVSKELKKLEKLNKKSLNDWLNKYEHTEKKNNPLDILYTLNI